MISGKPRILTTDFYFSIIMDVAAFLMFCCSFYSAICEWWIALVLQFISGTGFFALSVVSYRFWISDTQRK